MAVPAVQEQINKLSEELRFLFDQRGVEAAVQASFGELGLTTVEDAAHWLDRVRGWEGNLRRDMREDSVAAPGGALSLSRPVLSLSVSS